MLKALKTAGKWLLEVITLAFFVAAFLFLFFAFTPALAAGTTAQLSWVMPVQYTDDSPLPASDIAESVVEWRRTAAGPVLGTVRVPAPATTHSVPGLACGDFVFTVRVVTRSSAAHPNATGDASSPPTAYATGITCRPKAPSLSVT